MIDRTGNDHTTPEWILNPLRDAYGPIGLDPCWNRWAITDPVHKFDGCEHGDGIEGSWHGKGWVFVNPPFGRGLMNKWAQKYHDNALEGVPMVILTQLEARTKWSRLISDSSDYRVDLRGYVRFGGAEDRGAMHSHCLHIANLHGRLTHERFRKWGAL